MRRAVVVLVLGLAVSVPAASSTTAAGWKGLKYFDYGSQHLVVATDAAWKGGRVVKALPTQRLQFISGPGLRRTTPQWLWATTCGSAAQFVSFTREIRAPGDPQEGLLNLTLGWGRDLPFKSGELLINGMEVARIAVPPSWKGFPKAFSAPLSTKALKAFNYGVNTLTIRAERKALPKGQACNSPNRLVGVFATLSLRFRPDLVAVPSPAGAEAAYRIAPGQTAGGFGTLRFRNVGPSGSPGGKFVFTWSVSGSIQTAFTPSSFDLNLPFSTCKGEGINTGQVVCGYGDFPVGTSTAIRVITPARATASFTPSQSATLQASWEILPDGGDKNAGNNSFIHTIVLCGSANKEPRCANAK